MAVVKYGAIVTDIKGKIGGQIFQGGRSGGIFKNKGNPLRARRKSGAIIVGGTPRVNQINFADVAKGWAKLTVIQRTSWDALLGVWTFTNRFGEVYNGTAYQIYCACNMNARILELAPVLSAPISIAAVDPGYIVGDYSLTLGWDLQHTSALPQPQDVLISMSRNQNETKNLGSITFNKAGISDISGAGSSDGSVPFVNLYGAPPELGSFVWVSFWTTIQAYPKKQFVETFQAKVVA